ncbi:hypothetical protein RYZ26_06805 [Terasakiella sp. A23]|uniref:hypothetical protein n=1 Tax=Terasakiella sp. FCG-A23 TaxID=3080561 RepID=UPI002955B63D|nr:hypothetical protein [Terasakiella sp. A23]MDV7339296.1 hypothetical protein [Terasakiella sp. A23]
MHILSKKIIILSFLVVVSLGLIAGFLLSSGSDTDDTQSAYPKVSRKALYEGIAKNLDTLSEDDQLKISMLIPGNVVKENVWSFSGTFKGESADRPFFGQIRMTCQVVETHACWKLQELVIDGTPYTLAIEDTVQTEELLPEEKENQILETTENQESGAKQEIKAEIEQTPNQEDTISKEIEQSVTKIKLPPKAPAVKSEEISIYRTVSDNVNARMGPGSDHGIAFKMPSSVSLKLLKKDGKWGEFEYKGANDQTGKIWIALSLVKKVN